MPRTKKALSDDGSMSDESELYTQTGRSKRKNYQEDYSEDDDEDSDDYVQTKKSTKAKKSKKIAKPDRKTTKRVSKTAKTTKSTKKSTTTAKKTTTKKKKGDDDDDDAKKAFLIGQKYETPPETDPSRAFYTSLYDQKPSSKMAKKWCLEYGCLDPDDAKKIYNEIEKEKSKLKKR